MGCQRDCSRYRWTKVTAIAPSPTADATRFTELCRTSPAANDPGTLVSRKKGWRSSVQHAGGRPSENKSPARVSDDGGLACPVGVWGATDADKEPRRIDPRRRACPHRYEAQANRTRRHYARESRERGKPRSIP